ncbi:MAG: hypothetical protein V2A73_10445, partial [Pseudomonadota bacterium]
MHRATRTSTIADRKARAQRNAGVSRSVNGLAVLGPLSLVPSSLFNSDDDEGNKELGTRNQELEQPP